MRKILLATTAIVAMSAGSAMAADITITGSFELGYKNTSINEGWGDKTNTAAVVGTANAVGVAGNNTYVREDMRNGSDMYVQSDVNINFAETTDSGLTMKMGYGLDENGATDTANTDDINFSIHGDFGEVYATSTGDDSAARRLDIEAAYTPDEYSSSHVGVTSSGDNSAVGETSAATTGGTIISYFLPTMVEGLSAGVSYSNAGMNSKANATEWAAKYSGSASGMSYTVHYAAGSKDANGAASGNAHEVEGRSTSGYGIEISANGFTVGSESTSVDKDNESNDIDYTATSVKYVMGNITLAYNVESRNYSTSNTSDVDRNAASISYSIAPGLTANVTTSSTTEGTGTTQDEDDSTIFALNASF